LSDFFELVNADRRFSDQRMAIIKTVGDVFNISPDEYKSIENFVIRNESNELDDESILIINDIGKHFHFFKAYQIRSTRWNHFAA